MRLFKSMIFYLVCFSYLLSGNNHHAFNQNEDPIEIHIIEQNQDYVIINYKINDYTISDYNYGNELFHTVSIDGEPNYLISGFPDLPHINRSLIIPDYFSGNLSIIDVQFIELENINVIPSKGNITRNIDISLIPYVKGDIYQQNIYFPSNIVELKDPYILRDFRGQVLQINPFLFNPLIKRLQIYTDITVRIDFNGLNSINQYTDRNISKKMVYDFDNLYKSHFLNYDSYQTRYTPLEEDGEMLVICYDSFCDEVQPLVDWKNQKGIKTTLIPKSQAGTTVSSIKNYIANFYNTHDLTYVLLVGDKNQIPSQETGGGWSSGESDVYYAYLSGNDSYPEFFIGRFSAQNPAHVNTEVERSIEYEKSPNINGDWYTKGLMIASNEGAGAGHDGGESDWQHARNMRSDLMDYYYTDIDEMYDSSHGGEDNNGNPSDSMVRNAINGGLGIIHYTGHGDTDVWVTSNFNTGDVNALTNQNELPFICTVGCKSGDFGGTCLGETFTYATNGGEPTGAIATFMSTIYQSWAPPMEAQDEMVDILVENYSNNRKYTFGGISWNGCLKMNDAYGSDGDAETDHWTLFGDPSIALRTKTPDILSISHGGTIAPEEQAYEVIINDIYDNVLASLSYQGIYLGSGYAEGNAAVILLEEDISSYDEITLTVTGYNTTTVVESVLVGGCNQDIFGDINGDSILNILDIIILVNIILGIDVEDDCQVELSDVNQDGILNILDIVIVVNTILGN
tara:strand:- start:7617 stop:9833 length:2217 start_codon:yes stop_codon:yes gene_type:complete